MDKLGSTAVPIVALALVFGVVVLLLMVIWSIRRHRDPDLHIECDSPIEELIPSLAGLTLSTAVARNAVEIFENGAYFDVLLEEIRAARQSIHFETFLWTEGAPTIFPCCAKLRPEPRVPTSKVKFGLAGSVDRVSRR